MLEAPAPEETRGRGKAVRDSASPNGVLDVASQLGQQTVTFIDARDQGTYEAGHIPGALYIDAERLARTPWWSGGVGPCSKISGVDCVLFRRTM